MWPFVALTLAWVSLLPALASGQPTVELVLGILGSFNGDLRTLSAIVAADLDYRKNFEPALVERFGPPILPIPNASFNPRLRVRPVVAEDGGKEAFAVYAASNFIYGTKGYPNVTGVIGPFTSTTALATAPCTAAFKINQIAIGPNAEDFSDKSRFPYFFRTTSPGSLIGRAMWQYVLFYGFRSLTVITVLQSGMMATRDGILEEAAKVQRSEAITSVSIRDTSSSTDKDMADWATAIALAKGARNRLVIIIPSLPTLQLSTMMLYLSDHGLCAPRFQLLMPYTALLAKTFSSALSNSHIVNFQGNVDSAVFRFVVMLMSLNVTDFTDGIERYAFDKWRPDEPDLQFNRSRLSEALITRVPETSQISLLGSVFNAYNVYVRAFGALLNEGVKPEEIKGEALRAKIANTSFDSLLVRSAFDANQDGILDFSFSSLQVEKTASGYSSSASTSQSLAICRREKAPLNEGSSFVFTVVPTTPAPWATGQVALTAPRELTACPPGQYLATQGIGVGNGPGICKDCLIGTFTNDSDQTECTFCPAGTIGAEARDGCIDCPLGQYAPEKASKVCTSCMPGSVAGKNGSVACTLCPYGTYAETIGAGATKCLPCAEGLTTPQVASLSADSCVCSAGTYKPMDGSPCTPCGKGLSCPTGSEEANFPTSTGRRLSQTPGPYPEVLPRFFTRASEPLSVYECLSETVCPGGPPQSCAENHQGLVCGDCAAGFHRTSDGRCQACTRGDSTPIALTVVFAFLAIIGLTIYSNHEEGSQRLTVVTAVLAAGQLVSCVQALSVVQQVRITWVEPLLSLWQITGFFSFNMDVLKVQCVLGSDTPVNNFVMQLLVLPVVGTLLALSLLFTSYCRRRRIEGAAHKPRLFNLDRYFNLLGLLLVMAYISITVAMLRPLICKTHPNGHRSVASRLTVLCWESAEHRALVGLSAVGVVFYPVTLLSTVAWGTLQYPQKAATGSLAHLSRFRFVFARFKPDCYFWGFWYLSRNLALALVPVISADSGTTQMMLLCVILLPFVTMEAVLLPWRTLPANVSEICSVLGLLLFLQAAGFLVGAQTGGNPSLVSYLLMSIVITMLVASAMVVLYAILKTLSPGTQYAAFLCHHKEGAGSLARWFKIQVGTISKARVFLDSDQLEELDLIVETVRSRTKNLLILLTRQTLTRIWCAAEIASAVLNKVAIVQVACCDYVPCDEKFLDELGDVWSELQKHAVLQYGITLDHIRKGYEHLATLEAVQLRRFAPQKEQHVAIFRALHLCGICGPNVPPRPEPKTFARILVGGASSDAEARITCEVLKHLVQLRVEVIVATAHCKADAEAHSIGASYLLVVLTRGLMQDAAFIEVGLVLDAADRPAPIELVTALADTNFAFPPADVFEGLERQGGEYKLQAAFFRRVFNILALPLSPMGSEGIMGAQVGEICRRFRDTELAGRDNMVKQNTDASSTFKFFEGVAGAKGKVFGAFGSESSKASKETQALSPEETAEVTDAEEAAQFVVAEVIVEKEFIGYPTRCARV